MNKSAPALAELQRLRAQAARLRAALRTARSTRSGRAGGSLRGAPLEHHHRQLGSIAFDPRLVAVLRSGLLHHSNPAGALGVPSISRGIPAVLRSGLLG